MKKNLAYSVVASQIVSSKNCMEKGFEPIVESMSFSLLYHMPVITLACCSIKAITEAKSYTDEIPCHKRALFHDIRPRA